MLLIILQYSIVTKYLKTLKQQTLWKFIFVSCDLSTGKLCRHMFDWSGTVGWSMVHACGLAIFKIFILLQWRGWDWWDRNSAPDIDIFAEPPDPKTRRARLLCLFHGHSRLQRINLVNAHFGFKLYRSLRNDVNQTDNILLAPIGISIAMGMMSLGAGPKTYTQLYPDAGICRFRQCKPSLWQRYCTQAVTEAYAQTLPTELWIQHCDPLTTCTWKKEVVVEPRVFCGAPVSGLRGQGFSDFSFFLGLCLFTEFSLANYIS